MNISAWRRPLRVLTSRHPSIRLRVVASVFLAVLLVEALVGVPTLIVHHVLVSRDSEQALTQVRERVARAIEQSPTPIDADRLTELALTEGVARYFGRVDFALFTPDGRMIASAGSDMTRAERAMRQLARASQGSASSGPLVPARLAGDPSGRRWLGLARDVQTAEGPATLILTARDDVREYSTVMLGSVIAVVGLVGLMLSVPAGLFIAHFSAVPLEKMRAAMRGLEPGAIHKPIRLSPDSEEVLRLQKEVNNARKRLQEGYQQQFRFLEEVAHELKTPVSVVLADAQQTAASAQLDDRGRRFTAETADTMRGLARLVDRFLLLAKVQEGERRLHFQPTPINDIVLDSVEEASSYARQHSVHVVPTLLDDPPDAEAEVDGVLVQSALVNMIQNGVRFSPSNGQIDVWPTLEADRVVFHVRDQGPGVPQELQDSLFERYKSGIAPQGRRQGTGLGLTIAKRIAEVHGGEITVENCDKGALFCFAVPIRRSGSREPEPVGAAAEE